MQTTFKNLDLLQAVDILRDLNSRKLDIIAPIGALKMSRVGDNLILPYTAGNQQATAALNLSDHAVSQIADKMRIPANYLRRCIADGDGLAATNFNYWAQKEWEDDSDKARRMLVRAYLDDNGATGTMRALLSNSYGTYDNLSVLTVAMQAITDSGMNFRVDDLSLTDTNFYARFSNTDTVERVPDLLRTYRDPNGGEFGGTGEDDGICIGFELRNSEVGAGKLSIAPLLKVFACSNRMIFKEQGFDRRHLGAKMDEGEMTQAVAQKNWELIQVQVTESLKEICSPEYIGQRVEDLRALKRCRVMNAQKVCNGLGHSDYGLSKETVNSVLDKFLRAAYESREEPTAWHLAQAITAQAHHEDAGMRSWMERLAPQAEKIVARFDFAEVLVQN